MMQNSNVFIPGKLRSVISELSPRFFLPSEFPLRQPGSETQLLLKVAAGLPADELAHFSYQLKSSDVEALILWLPFDETGGAYLIANILKHRANHRFLKIFWPFYQYHYQNINVTEAAKIILSGHIDSISGNTAALRNLQLFAFSDGLPALLQKILSDGTPLGVFATEEALLLDSPLAERLFAQYFCRCTKDGFLLNTKRLLRILSALEKKEADQIVVNYLQQLERYEFLPDVNSYILSLWGEPYTSAGWADIPRELQQKMAEWISYRRLEQHFVKNKLKLRILNTVVPHMHQVRLSGDAGFLAADFGDFYIVDDNEISSYSYYVDKALFEQLQVDFEEPGFDNFKDSVKSLPDARAFMIEETEGSFMQLEYENLGRLYIADMLNIKLDVTPDLRPSKSILRKKRQIASNK